MAFGFASPLQSHLPGLAQRMQDAGRPILGPNVPDVQDPAIKAGPQPAAPMQRNLPPLSQVQTNVPGLTPTYGNGPNQLPPQGVDAGAAAAGSLAGASTAGAAGKFGIDQLFTLIFGG